MTRNFNPYSFGYQFGRYDLSQGAEGGETVSILILLDISLEAVSAFFFINAALVSILILLDISLEEVCREFIEGFNKGFNPYSFGYQFGSLLPNLMVMILLCFNPYSFGYQFGR